MRSHLAARQLAALWLASVPLAAQDDAGPRPGVDWPQFRGAEACGVAEGHALPSEWNVPDGEGVRWKTAIPGLSHSSPIVWGERVFVATAVKHGEDASLKIGLYGAGDSAEDMVEHAFQLWCLDARDGRPIWVRTVARTVPKFARHTKATHADPTPVTDGHNVVAVFGSHGMFCFGADGEQRWHVDLGNLDVGPHNSLDLQWGYASSPVIADGKVIVQADVKENAFLGAWNVDDGKQVWRVARDDTPGWATPTVVDDQVVVNGCKHMGAYRLADGGEVWRMAGGGGIPIPAPITAGDRVLLTSNHRPLIASHPVKPIFAVNLDATGELPVPQEGETAEPVAWMRTPRR